MKAGRPQIRRVGIIIKQTREDPLAAGRKLHAWLVEKGIEPLVTRSTAGLLGTERAYPRSYSQEKLAEQADLVVVLGGDGTLLYAARVVAAHEVPILGVNVGGLGFLTEVPLDEFYPVLEKVLSGDYEVSERMMIDATVRRDGKEVASFTVLNDVVINKGALARIIEMDVQADGAHLTKYRADGLIVSTPTGSTAYSLAAGGPIVTPLLNAITLTPICPHTLTNRAIVLQAVRTIDVRLISKSEEEDVKLTMDGQVGFDLKPKDEIGIMRSPRTTRLVRSPFRNYFEILRAKLHWGGGGW